MLKRLLPKQRTRKTSHGSAPPETYCLDSCLPTLSEQVDIKMSRPRPLPLQCYVLDLIRKFLIKMKIDTTIQPEPRQQHADRER